MSIMKYSEPWALLDQFHQELNKLNLLDRYSSIGSDRSDTVTNHWSPAIDLKEDDKQYTIYADLPGIDPEDISITMEEGVLTIRGERYSETSDEQTAFKRTERARGAFYRRFSLPDIANTDAIEAKNDKGVLTIVIPKQEKAQPRRITIKS